MWQRLHDQHPAGPKTPQEWGTSDEEAEAMPVESEPNGAEINGLHDFINNDNTFNNEKTLKDKWHEVLFIREAQTDHGTMYYLIESLKRRIAKLDEENKILKSDNDILLGKLEKK